MPRHSANSSRSDASTSSSESSSSSDDDAFRRRKPPKLSLRRLRAAVSASVERAPPHHRDRAALEVAELLLHAYLDAKKEVKAELERLAFSFYSSPSSLLGLSLAARRQLERAAASVFPDSRRKGFLRVVRDASIAEKRVGGKSAARAEEGDAEAKAEVETSAAGDENGDSGSGLFPGPLSGILSLGLFELVPDVVRHVADFLAPVDALAAAGVCEFFLFFVVEKEREKREKRHIKKGKNSLFPFSLSNNLHLKKNRHGLEAGPGRHPFLGSEALQILWRAGCAPARL